MQAERETQGPASEESGLEASRNSQNLGHWFSTQSERMAGNAFVLPAVLIVLFLSVFPLIISLYLSFSQLRFVSGGFEINFVGLNNFRKLLTGSQQSHFLGVMADITPVGWTILFIITALMIYGLVGYFRGSQISLVGGIGRIIAVVIAVASLWLLIRIFSPGGRPGTLVVTLIYVFVGIVVQFSIALGLALLTSQPLPGRRFFRVIYLIPMMITPVGVAYMFRMLTDTTIGPFSPIWQALGLASFSWVNDPWGARIAVIIGDAWQWIPFMFIVLLAALEGQSADQFEAALVDGANRRQIFWYVTWPQILPVSLAIILIRMIEAFKIIDLPNVMTGGGPGTATESLTLHSYISWRTLDLGGSAAIAYILLFVVTFFALTYVNLIRNRATEA